MLTNRQQMLGIALACIGLAIAVAHALGGP